MQLQNQLEELTRDVDFLKEIVSHDPNGKKITIKGRLSFDDDPKIVAKFVLKEKLNLSPNIQSAVKNDDNSITFEVAIEDKLEIMKWQRTILQNATSVIFSYP